jgi:broad specificity phosphatase PhoE
VSQLVLVRHGQATLFADTYDQLSPLGETQSRRLGEYWVEQGMTFDAVYTGTLHRQQRTMDLVAEVYAKVGRAWPTPIHLEGLNEYDGDAIMRDLLPPLRERDARLHEMAALAERHTEGPERYRHYQRLFEAVTSAWLDGVVDAPGVETWRAFYDRVSDTWRRILRDEGKGRRVVAFTSGGPIAVAVQMAVRAPEATALELNWRIRNAALTEIVFSGERVSLDTFNTVPHLTGSYLWTYR